MFGLESGHINISMSAVMSMRKFIGILGISPIVSEYYI